VARYGASQRKWSTCTGTKNGRNGATYVEISLHERKLAYGNVHRRVVCRVLRGGPTITENGYIREVTEVKTPTESMR